MDITVNGKEYAWGQIEIRLNGYKPIGCRAVMYTDEEEQDFARGQGNKPLGIQRGNISYTGSLRVLQYELDKLIDMAPGKRLQSLPAATLVVSYSNEVGDLVTDTLIGVKFSKVEKGLNQGDLSGEKELPFLFLELQLHS